MRQYQMYEVSFQAEPPKGSQVKIDLMGSFALDGEVKTVKGFYAGDNTYKVRFLPEKAGTYRYEIKGSCLMQPLTGSVDCAPADGAHHGPVRADGTHLRYADGNWFYSFGTTVYALVHQPKALVDETMASLKASPFNKVRMCVFPKHYVYNFNEPDHYAFEKKPGQEGADFTVKDKTAMPMRMDPQVKNEVWDVDRPCFAFWDQLEARLMELGEAGIVSDLILFHPYDRWGFSCMPMEDNFTYLDYLLRRLSAFPNLFWSLANEYDLCLAKSLEDWEAIECFVADNDPFHHMLSNHNCFRPWNFSRKNTTHVSWQSKTIYRANEMARRFGKPVLFDECRYEGNIPETWGNISGREMTARFWRAMSQGAYCTHGQTFLPGTELGDQATDTGIPEVVWWARGGKLVGESPARIAFLRDIIESLPGPLDPSQEGMSWMVGLSDDEVNQALESAPKEHRAFLSRLTGLPRIDRDQFLGVEYAYNGRCGEDAYLWYKDDQCLARATINLPEDKTYWVDVIDTWNMTRTRAMTGAHGRVTIDMPGRPEMAILAVREDA